MGLFILSQDSGSTSYLNSEGRSEGERQETGGRDGADGVHFSRQMLN